jgi:PAS domain S-box-containing protein
MGFKYRLIKNNDLESLYSKNALFQSEAALASQFIKALGSAEANNLLLSEEFETSTSNELLQELKLLEDKLRNVAEEEKQRNWSAIGLANFSQLLREHDDDLEKLTSKFLSKLVTYVSANQGSIFVKSKQEERIVLEQKACYAYDRKKHVNSIIEIGEGILGQTFLEKETTLLTEVPDNYVHITSGLGDATPRSLVLVPIMINEDILGILELASFSVFPAHVVQFLEKVCESLASTISSAQIKIQTQALLVESQEKTEQMKSQEEELRQNLEELQATQEQMERKQRELDQKGNLIQLILDKLPIPTFVKDDHGIYTMVNKAQSTLLNLTEKEIIGKDDTSFTKDEKERAEIKRSDIDALQSIKPIELPTQSFTTSEGRNYIFKTTKVSFLNTITNKRNVIGISIDMTDRIKLEQKILSERVLQQNNVLIDLAGRQRMLSQKISFLCEMICRGNTQHVSSLRKAIDLHDHSLEVIKKGGWPMDIEAHVPLEKAHVELLPFIKIVEEVWVPFKEAADKIATLGAITSSIQTSTLEKTILIIEENGDKLLQVNNQLLIQYKKITQKELSIEQ